MPIATIKKYASLFQEGEHTAADRLKLLEEHKESIQKQMHILNTADEMLEHKISSYRTFIGQ